MCGNAGIYDFADGRAAGHAMLETVRPTLYHRGTDGSESVPPDRADMVHARLSILICSPADHQKMRETRCCTCLSLDANICDLRNIRHRLNRNGADFPSACAVISQSNMMWLCP